MQAVFWSPDLKETIRSSVKQFSKKESDSFIFEITSSETTNQSKHKSGKNGQEPGRPRPENWD